MTPFHADDKQPLRRRMRSTRSGVTDRAARTARLWVAVSELCEAEARARSRRLRVLAFCGVGNEPDTAPLLARLADAGHGVLLPRVEGDHIVAVEHAVGAPLLSGAYGIPEPPGPAVDPASIDLVLVPGLAFTADGKRLGQGGGYYDRFLPLLRADCTTCGVGFAEQLVEWLPTEAHDRTLAAVLTA